MEAREAKVETAVRRVESEWVLGRRAGGRGAVAADLKAVQYQLGYGNWPRLRRTLPIYLNTKFQILCTVNNTSFLIYYY